MKSFRYVFALLAAAALLSATSARAADESRFSKTVSATEFTSLGLNQLSSDELAILDALVRRDIAQSKFVSKTPRAVRFSERLSSDERHNAGLDHLSAEAIASLDARVERLITPPASSSGVRFAAQPYSVPSVKIRRGPEVHGQAALMVAVGSHGYSAYGGGLAVTLDDPASKFSLTLAYSEVHSKGGAFRGGCYDDFGYGRLYDPLDPFARRW